jgi:hypothetical protein
VRWHCLWRKIGALPDELRPDRSGVMFAIENRGPCEDVPERACIVGRAVNGAGVFASPEVIEAFAMFTREGSLPVWKVSGRNATLMHPQRGVCS